MRTGRPRRASEPCRETVPRRAGDRALPAAEGTHQIAAPAAAQASTSPSSSARADDDVARAQAPARARSAEPRRQVTTGAASQASATGSTRERAPGGDRRRVAGTAQRNAASHNGRFTGTSRPAGPSRTSSAHDLAVDENRDLVGDGGDEQCVVAGEDDSALRAGRSRRSHCAGRAIAAASSVAVASSTSRSGTSSWRAATSATRRRCPRESSPSRRPSSGCKAKRSTRDSRRRGHVRARPVEHREQREELPSGQLVEARRLVGDERDRSCGRDAPGRDADHASRHPGRATRGLPRCSTASTSPSRSARRCRGRTRCARARSTPVERADGAVALRDACHDERVGRATRRPPSRDRATRTCRQP